MALNLAVDQQIKTTPSFSLFLCSWLESWVLINQQKIIITGAKYTKQVKQGELYLLGQGQKEALRFHDLANCELKLNVLLIYSSIFHLRWQNGLTWQCSLPFYAHGRRQHCSFYFTSYLGHFYPILLGIQPCSFCWLIYLQTFKLYLYILMIPMLSLLSVCLSYLLNTIYFIPYKCIHRKFYVYV